MASRGLLVLGEVRRRVDERNGQVDGDNLRMGVLDGQRLGVFEGLLGTLCELRSCRHGDKCCRTGGSVRDKNWGREEKRLRELDAEI
jgi:hypothetical protein